MSRRLRISPVAAALALASGCSLSMDGKDLCGVASDCLDGYRCYSGHCVTLANCPVACGEGCCDSDQTCISGQCQQACQPVCKGRQCGDDGCHGSCGDCGLGWKCNGESFLCEICQADCSGKQCGSDGCGRTCGTCGYHEECTPEFLCRYVAPDAGTGVTDAGIIVFGDGGIADGDAGPLVPADAASGGTDAGSEVDSGSGDDAGDDGPDAVVVDGPDAGDLGPDAGEGSDGSEGASPDAAGQAEGGDGGEDAG